MYFSLKNEWFAHSLFFGERCEANRSGRSPKISDVSESLRSLIKNELTWAIRSGRSEEMSDREPIAQVAQDKWATLSDLLRPLRVSAFSRKNEITIPVLQYRKTKRADSQAERIGENDFNSKVLRP